jgi:outer membrane protein assembly factor BamA
LQKRPKYLLAVLLLLGQTLFAQQYTVRYQHADAGATADLFLPGKFTSQSEAESFINKLPQTLRAKGFIAASVDSVAYDSLAAFVVLFTGPQYRWAKLRTRPQDALLLEAIRWPEAEMNSGRVDFEQVQSLQAKALDYLEERGHPFGKVYLDSIELEGDAFSALLQIDPGPAYHIDSIRVLGEVSVKPELLERYLGMVKGSPYNRRKLEAISNRIKELAYVQEERPSTVSLQGTGAVVNLYLKPRRSSQAGALIGFLPNPNTAIDKKVLVTGEANVLLRNSLGAGETIGLNWQQLQAASPRLHVQYGHPFLFRSPVGLSFTFDMLRRDSTWLNVDLNLGASFAVNGNRTAAVFLQRRQTILSTIDTVAIRRRRELPPVADVASNNLGVSYAFWGTDYRFNPRRGLELEITGTAGTKQIKPNNQVTELKEDGFDFARLYDTVKLRTYQLRIVATAARYLPIGKQAVVKTGVNVGIYQSGSYYYNELFQVGGYKLLRGFTEESQFLSHYALGTLEYRYLIGQNSYFFGFLDGGWGKNAAGAEANYSFVGTGLGIALETGAGIFNLAWAVGKRNDTDLNLRQSKVHLGFVNYF